MNKTKRGTILLFSIFLVLFIVSIIGIIYSYNKRIFQLAKQERDNYKFFKKQFDEMFTNLYIVDLIKEQWISQELNLNSFSYIQIPPPQDLSYSYQESFEIKDQGQDPKIEVNANLDLTNNILTISGGPINKSFTLQELIYLKNQRNNIINSFTSNSAKEEIENKLKLILGDNIEIVNFNPTIHKNNNNSQGTIEYKIEVIKK
jgi:hypothetical protein